MKLQRLVYVSTATVPIGSVMEVSDILEESVRNNSANNITGALAFTETRFIQLLEGSHGSLDVLLLKLLIDPRHRDLVIVDRTPIETRSFGAWSMLAPAFTPTGRQRLTALATTEIRPMDDFRLLLLAMVAEQSAQVTRQTPPA